MDRMVSIFAVAAMAVTLPVAAKSQPQGSAQPSLRPKMLMIGPLDYPRQALKEGRVGTTHFRLSVSAKGKVQSCEIEQSSGSTDLDSTTCKAMRSARFAPARDEHGKPVASDYRSEFRWQTTGPVAPKIP